MKVLVRKPARPHPLPELDVGASRAVDSYVAAPQGFRYARKSRPQLGRGKAHVERVEYFGETRYRITPELPHCFSWRFRHRRLFRISQSSDQPQERLILAVPLNKDILPRTHRCVDEWRPIDVG